MAQESILADPHIQDEILQFLVNDRDFLKQASHLLVQEDFRGSKKDGLEREMAAKVALNFWNRYRQPVGKLLRSELRDLIRREHPTWESDPKPENRATKKLVLEYGETLTNGHKRVAGDALLGKLRQYKIETKITEAIDQMQMMVEQGSITTDDFLRLAREAVDGLGKEAGAPVEIFDQKDLERRIARRNLQRKRQRFPVLLIDPIDRMVKIIARKHLGLILAPYKRGKTLFFVWLALAYTLQGLNVMHFTLEDPQEDMEDKFDAAITALPLSRLSDNPERVREKFARYKKLVRSRLKVIDGTDGGITIGAIENIWERERNRGYVADVILIDYDDEIRPMRKQSERRMEFADIYRDFRAVLARHSCIGWTASQTSRKADEMKIIKGGMIAEDISKIRKATMALSLGQGEWGEDSIFMWVAAHRNDVQHVGANIMTDKARSLFYDRDATLEQEKIARAKKVP